MEKNKEFYTQLCSDLDFEGMVVDICLGNQLIAQVNYEKGIDKIEVEFLKNTSNHVFKINGLIDVLEKAKNIAIRCAKEDKERNFD